MLQVPSVYLALIVADEQVRLEMMVAMLHFFLVILILCVCFFFSDSIYFEPMCINPEYKELSSNCYASQLLICMNRLYEERICCDVVLTAGGFQVEAHKLVLMAASDYFKTLLTEDEGLEPSNTSTRYLNLSSKYCYYFSNPSFLLFNIS